MADYLTASHYDSALAYLESRRKALEGAKRDGLEMVASFEGEITSSNANTVVQDFKKRNLSAAERLCQNILRNDYWMISKEEKLFYTLELYDIMLNTGPLPKVASIIESFIKPGMCNRTAFRAYLLAGHANRLIGKVEIAQNFYQQAKSFASNMEDGCDATLTIIYDQLCVYSTGKNKEPLECLIPLLSQSLDVESAILLHQALGNIYRSAADWHNSIEHFKKAIQLAKTNNYVCKAMECKAELGRAYRSSGCHSKALKRQEKFLEFAVNRGDPVGIAAACGYVGFTYFSMGSEYYSEATKYLYSKLMLSKGDLDDISGYRWCLNNLGKVYLGLKEYDICILLFKESAKIAKELGNMLGLGTAYGNLGSACRATGRHEEAINYHKLYLDIAQQNSDTGGVAIMQRELILDHLYLYNSPGTKDKKEIFLKQARRYAIEALKTSLEVRSRLGKDDILKIGHFEHNQAKIYSLLLFILAHQNLHEASLVVSELGRAHALADHIMEKFKITSALASDVLKMFSEDNEIQSAEVHSLNDKIGGLISKSNSDLLVYSMLEDPLSKECLLYTWFVCQSNTGREVYFKQQIASKSVSVSNCCLFSEDYFAHLLHEIGVADEALAEEIESLSVGEIEKSSSFEKPRDIVRRKVPQSSHRHETDTKKDILEELYDKLILPVSPYMKNSSSTASKLIIIPHGLLFRIPFCALKKGDKFLIENFIISIFPSLNILDISLQREKEWLQLQSSKEPVQMLAVGNPTMPTMDLQLPGAEKEVKSLASLVDKATVLCGPKATKQKVLSGFTQYPIIHLATHAILESSLADIATPTPTQYEVGNYEVKGAIILAKSDDSCSGVLTSSEIETLKLDPSCELVVLNCCNTGKGTITGDGVLGLSRSLMCAGVMNMIVTLWRIEDKSAAMLMQHFYGLYKEKRDASTALHCSMLEMIQHGYPCKKWAAFNCIGIRHHS